MPMVMDSVVFEQQDSSDVVFLESINVLRQLRARKTQELFRKIFEQRDSCCCALDVCSIFCSLLSESKSVCTELLGRFGSRSQKIEELHGKCQKVFFESLVGCLRITLLLTDENEIQASLCVAKRVQQSLLACAPVAGGGGVYQYLVHVDKEIKRLEEAKSALSIGWEQYFSSVLERLSALSREWIHRTPKEKEWSESVLQFRATVQKVFATSENVRGTKVEVLKCIENVFYNHLQVLEGSDEKQRTDALERIANFVIGIQRIEPKLLSACADGIGIQEVRPQSWVRDLAQEFRQRLMLGENQTGLKALHKRDKERLLAVLLEHNIQFVHRVRIESEDGSIDKIDVDQGTNMYVRADLHGDLSVLLAQLDMHVRMGDMDEKYCCRPGFHVIFLGDHLDRGSYDIETCTLLLGLRMLNPFSVHLIRGNHENVDVQKEHSLEWEWINEHKEEFSECYKSFPVALCIGEKRGVSHWKEDREYVHFSHGLFSTSVELSSLLSSSGSASIGVLNAPNMLLAHHGTKKRRHSLKHLQSIEQAANKYGASTIGIDGYLWSDVGQTGLSARNAGYVLSADDIYHYSRASRRGACKVKAFLRGHSHKFREHMVDRKSGEQKVLITTLPVGSIGDASGGFQKRQGMMLRVAHKVSDWTKQLAIAREEGGEMTLILEDRAVGLYEKIRP